jgi:hypothetical protein
MMNSLRIRLLALMLVICTMFCLPAYAGGEGEFEPEYDDEPEVLLSGKFAYTLQDGLVTIVDHISSEYGWSYWYGDDRPEVDHQMEDEEKSGWDRYSLVIPERLDGYPVVAIADGAFTECGFNDITIPEGIVSIGSYAFFACYSVYAVTIPESVSFIGEGAFERLGPNREGMFRVARGSCADHYAKQEGFPYTYDWNYRVFTHDDYLYTLEDGTATIRGYYGDALDLVVPDRLDGYMVRAVKPVSVISGMYFANVISLTIPAGVTDISVYDGVPSLARIDVSPGNPVYEAFDGVLFDKQRKMLLFCPEAREGDYAIPEGTLRSELGI